MSIDINEVAELLDGDLDLLDFQQSRSPPRKPRVRPQTARTKRSKSKSGSQTGSRKKRPSSAKNNNYKRALHSVEKHQISQMLTANKPEKKDGKRVYLEKQRRYDPSLWFDPKEKRSLTDWREDMFNLRKSLKTTKQNNINLRTKVSRMEQEIQKKKKQLQALVEMALDSQAVTPVSPNFTILAQLRHEQSIQSSLEDKIKATERKLRLSNRENNKLRASVQKTSIPKLERKLQEAKQEVSLLRQTLIDTEEELHDVRGMWQHEKEQRLVEAQENSQRGDESEASRARIDEMERTIKELTSQIKSEQNENSRLQRRLTQQKEEIDERDESYTRDKEIFTKKVQQLEKDLSEQNQISAKFAQQITNINSVAQISQQQISCFNSLLSELRKVFASGDKSDQPLNCGMGRRIVEETSEWWHQVITLVSLDSKSSESVQFKKGEAELLANAKVFIMDCDIVVSDLQKELSSIRALLSNRVASSMQTEDISVQDELLQTDGVSVQNTDIQTDGVSVQDSDIQTEPVPVQDSQVQTEAEAEQEATEKADKADNKSVVDANASDVGVEG